ncbi:MAG TPA: class I SAM-dependent methyltransferase [Myxococcales bacterium]|nr:class I SAM-dependent methyltransferase [Myxococcales bacterium]
MSEFDKHARSYEAVHAQNLRPSGEAPSYFARYKQQTVERVVGRGFAGPVLDFGCGVGALTALLAESFRSVDGYDPSRESLSLARARVPSARFFDRVEALPARHYGAVVLANVLHHVPPAGRPGLVRSVAALLAPGGTLVSFEHNRLNPVTRRVVSACAFDQGAQLLYPAEVKRLLREAGLAAVALDYIVFFPRALRVLRPLEPWLARLPLGAQVCAWGRNQ